MVTCYEEDFDLDLERIEALIKVVKHAKVTELSVRQEGSAVTVKKSARGMAVRHPKLARKNGDSGEKSEDEIVVPAGSLISAYKVGIFHLLDGAAALGTHVRKGQALGSIESMKLMNEVVSPEDGLITEVFIEDGMPVEYGHPLFRLETVTE